MTQSGTVQKTETVPIQSSSDVVVVRQRVRAWTTEMKFSLVEQTKIVTAASEIARNTVDYGRGGDLRMDAVHNGLKSGLRLTFSDQGPGIRDIEQALTDGFTSGNGMGLGLGGTRRLMDEFDIISRPNEGTTVTITKWSR